MNRNDKLIVLFGVLILILASIGVYYWVPEGAEIRYAEIDDFFGVSSSYAIEPGALTISDSCPFNALIATPVAVHYGGDGTQYIAPLYVINTESPSSAVERVATQIGVQPINEIDDSKSTKEYSLYIAEKYWESSDAVLLIENNETGYNLGVVATPIASYLGIPVVVTDEVDQEVRTVLDELGVTRSLVCGDIDGYGECIKFGDVDSIVDASIKIVREKFDDVNYITITNPRDAWPPEVLDKEILISDSGTLKGGNALPSGILKYLTGGKKAFSFVIPDDYKYALVKLEFKNLEDPSHIEMFGDGVVFQGSFLGYVATMASPAETDVNGNIECDTLYYEDVLYDMGGEELTVSAQAMYTVLDSAPYEITITAEKLEDPYYPQMKQFSSIAPYLTAYRKGIVFAKPEFAFVNDDDKIFKGKNLPGSTTIRKNPELIPLLNQHVYENVHMPINELLSKITAIDINESVEYLTKYCRAEPFYIAVVGDPAMVPQYFYRSPHNNPYDDIDTIYGTNCPSDFIYGNIDPELYSMQPYASEHVENDLYSTTEFPEVENIVGRIACWDVQDASALIDRTIFYDEVISGMGSWKDNAVVMSGAGLEFQKLPIFNTVYKLLGKSDPMKFPTGEQHFLTMRTAENLRDAGFDVETAERGQAQREGLSSEALRMIKTDGLLNRLLFPKLLVKLAQGFESVDKLKSLKWWSEALGDGSGINGQELQEQSNLILSNSHGIWFGYEHADIMLDSLGGPFLIYQMLGRFVPIMPFATPLLYQGYYHVRAVSNMEMGPSVMFIECCGGGKLDSLDPTNTLGNAYMHAGANVFISPSTYSAIGGYLEPRPNFPEPGVGIGLRGYLKALRESKRGVYPPVHFSGWVFEHAYENLINNDMTIGEALRNAKNDFLPDQIDVSYLWTPPLSLPIDLPSEIRDNIVSTSGAGTVPVEKYCTIYQLNLQGDPAFNPYEPGNEGSK